MSRNFMILLLGIFVLPDVVSAQGIRFAEESAEYPVGLSPIAVAVQDLDGDLIADVAVANNDGDNVSVFLGTATGDLIDTGIQYTVGQAPFAIVIADVNGDSRADIVTTCEGEDVVSVLINDGSANFPVEQRFDTGAAPQGLVARDFDGDQKVDLATADNFAETVTILKGSGNGTFSVLTSYVVGTAPAALSVGDLDGDQKLDLVVANTAGGEEANGSLSILKGKGDGTFLLQDELLLPEVCGAVGCLPVAVEAADFSGDAKLDLAVTNQDGDSVSIFLGNGDLTFATPTVFAVGSTPAAMAVADLDGDDDLDLTVTGSFDNFVSILLGNGDGTFAEAVDYEVGETPVSVAAGELNGDGKPDLVVVNQDDETITVLLTVGGCAGDCDGDQVIEMSDLISMVGLGLSGSSSTGCSNGDSDRSGGITVEEIVGAVAKAAAGGCVQ